MENSDSMIEREFGSLGFVWYGVTKFSWIKGFRVSVVHYPHPRISSSLSDPGHTQTHTHTHQAQQTRGPLLMIHVVLEVLSTIHPGKDWRHVPYLPPNPAHPQHPTVSQTSIDFATVADNWGLFLFLLAVRCVSLFSWFTKEDSSNSFFQMCEGIACVAQEHDDLKNWTDRSNKKKNFRCREIHHAFTHHYDEDTAYYGQFCDTEIKSRQLMWEKWRSFLTAICPDYLWKNTSRV